MEDKKLVKGGEYMNKSFDVAILLTFIGCCLLAQLKVRLLLEDIRATGLKPQERFSIYYEPFKEARKPKKTRQE